MAAERGAYIDQSQSLNLFMETPTIGKLCSMYLHAWKAGLKTTYYLRVASGHPDQPGHDRRRAPHRRRPHRRRWRRAGAGRHVGSLENPERKAFTDEEAIACSLANPEACEACD